MVWLGLAMSAPAVAQGALDTAQASAGGERIRSFDVTAKLDADRNLTVREEIVYDFGTADRHGIFRDIPESYERDNLSYNYRYTVKRVLRDGQDEPYQTSRAADIMTVKIGSADRTITGKHTYVIEYDTGKAINFFSDHSELYWNVTGNEWKVPIEKASFRLESPLKGEKPQQFLCYTGHLGSVEQACAIKADGNSLLVTANRGFEDGEGMTVVFAFPTGMIKQPTAADNVWEAVRDNLILLVPLLAFAFMFWWWRKRGKDLPDQTVVPQYESPHGLSPLVLSGAMGNGAIPQRGITATIIDMAQQGFLHIEYGTKKGLFSDSQTFTFIKKNQPGEQALAWEKILWNGLFLDGARDRSTFDDLKGDKFYNDVAKATSAATKQLTALKIFDRNPYLVRAIYFAVAIAAFAIVSIAGAASPAGGLAAFATALVVAVFGWFMPRRTRDGVNLVAEVKGFKWFMSVTEEERLKFHNAPARTPEQFMELLPAAIALGVEREWAEQFKDLQLAPPDWAEGNVGTWNAISMATAMTAMNSASAASVYSPPASTAGSGGSGFSGGGSGGGGGGGGGGSW